MRKESIALRIAATEPPAAGLQRVALALLDDALRRARSRSATRLGRNVHEIRKRFKEVRAVIGLLSHGRRAKWVVRLLKELARALAGRREADSVVQSYDRLRLGRLLERSQRDAVRAQLALRGPAGEMPHIAARIAAAREELETWDPATDTSPQFEREIRRSYRSARRRMMQSIATRDATTFHDWRKRVKEQWYQSLILGDAMPALALRAERLHELAEALGELHDLALLIDAMTAIRDTTDPHAFDVVMRRAAGRCAKVEKKSIALGAELFGPPAKAWAPA